MLEQRRSQIPSGASQERLGEEVAWSTPRSQQHTQWRDEDGWVLTPDFDGMCSCPISSPGHIKGLGQEETPVRSADLVFKERMPACNTHGEGHFLAPPAKYLQTLGRRLHSQHRTSLTVSRPVTTTTFRFLNADPPRGMDSTRPPCCRYMQHSRHVPGENSS